MESKLLYEELTYALNGALFVVHNELGRFCSEVQYADAVERQLRERGMPYERERILEPMFDGEQPGRHRVDFLIADAVILELKAKRALERSDFVQLLRYLTALNYKLGLLVNFRQRTLMPKRIVNPLAPVRPSAYPRNPLKNPHHQ